MVNRKKYTKKSDRKYYDRNKNDIVRWWSEELGKDLESFENKWKRILKKILIFRKS